MLLVNSKTTCSADSDGLVCWLIVFIYWMDSLYLTEHVIDLLSWFPVGTVGTCFVRTAVTWSCPSQTSSCTTRFWCATPATTCCWSPARESCARNSWRKPSPPPPAETAHHSATRRRPIRRLSFRARAALSSSSEGDLESGLSLRLIHMRNWTDELQNTSAVCDRGAILSLQVNSKLLWLRTETESKGSLGSKAQSEAFLHLEITTRPLCITHIGQSRPCIHPEALYLKPTKLLQYLKTTNSTFVCLLFCALTEGGWDQNGEICSCFLAVRLLIWSLNVRLFDLFRFFRNWRDSRVQLLNLSCQFALIWWQFCAILVF